MDNLEQELKALIIEECEKDISVDDISNDMALVNGDLDLDSLDVLQICVAIKNRYGVAIEGSGLARKVLKNITTLANYIRANQS